MRRCWLLSIALSPTALEVTTLRESHFRRAVGTDAARASQVTEVCPRLRSGTAQISSSRSAADAFAVHEDGKCLPRCLEVTWIAEAPQITSPSLRPAVDDIAQAANYSAAESCLLILLLVSTHPKYQEAWPGQIR